MGSSGGQVCAPAATEQGQAPCRLGQVEHRALICVRKGPLASSGVTQGAKMAREGDGNCF